VTKETLAASLDGREYPMRLTKDELRVAELGKLVIVTGASDDLMEFEGVITDEFGAPGEQYVTQNGMLPEHDEDCECKFCGYKDAVNKARKIEAVWNDSGNPCWTIKTEIPHTQFNVMEDGEVFCRGIVFCLADV
jgi:hypothetical protein